MLGSAPVSIFSGSGCSSVWLERYLGVVEVASSNLVTPTNSCLLNSLYFYRWVHADMETSQHGYEPFKGVSVG